MQAVRLPSLMCFGMHAHAEDYEPPGFKALDEEEAGFFARRPFAMDIGNVATQYHGVRLRVGSVPDAPPAQVSTVAPPHASIADVVSPCLSEWETASITS